MKKCKYIFVYFWTLSVLYLYNGSPRKRKQSSVSVNLEKKRAKYERDHYKAYLSNTELYTEWPELEVSKQVTTKTCTTYLEKLFPRKNFEKCTITPSIKRINLYYPATMSKTVGHVTKGPVILNSLECHIYPGAHRKYFHFIRASRPEYVYLISRQKPNSMNFNITLKFGMYHTYNHLKYKEEWEGAIFTHNQMRQRTSRDNATTKEQEEYERSHQLWASQVYVCHSSPRKCKISLGSDNLEIKRAEYETEQYEAYLSNTKLFKEWPELKVNEQLKNVETCKINLEKLFPKKDFKKRKITPLIKCITLHYVGVSNIFGHVIHEPVMLNSLECHVDPSVRHRKYFNFIRASKLECLYLINRLEPHSTSFYISARLCMNDEAMYGAIHKLNQLKVLRSCRDNDSIKQLEEYERSHQLWVKRDDVDKWPELESGNRKIFCRRVLGKLFPKCTKTLEDINPLFYFKYLKYTNLIKDNGSAFPLMKVPVITCRSTIPKFNRSCHTFIRAPNHGSLNCVYMIKQEKGCRTYSRHITKRLCVQNLYENSGHGEVLTITTGVTEHMNDVNVVDPITTQGQDEDSLNPTTIKKGLITDEEILRHLRTFN